jgi:hypothetical protein
MRKNRFMKNTLLLTALAFLAACSTARAQWVTESYALKPGWNAVWLPMDVTHEGIATLAHPDIQELWRWNAVEAGTFTDTPAGPPSQTELQWSVWRRTSPEGTTLNELTGNDAYLVKVASEVIFTVNRSALGNTPGAVFQGLVRLTDSLNQVKINLPVRAETTSRAGLWGGRGHDQHGGAG